MIRVPVTPHAHDRTGKNGVIGERRCDVRLLTATNETQGWRDSDFCWTVEGELVIFPVIECGDERIDEGCGCRRSMAGIVSHRATTTVKSVERPEIDPDVYFSMICEGIKQQGYVTDELMKKRDVEDWLKQLTDDLARMAGSAPAGTVFERRGEVMMVRKRSDNE